MAKKTSNIETTGGYENDAQLWQARYRVAYNNQLPMFKRFADWYDVMYAVVNTKNYNLWRSKVYLPILGSKAWQLISKFIALKPGFEVRVRDDGVSDEDLGITSELMDKAYKAQLKLEYDYDNPDMERPLREKLLSVLVDATVTGVGMAKVNWEVLTKTRYEYPVRADGTIDMSTEKVTESTVGMNDLTPVNIFNFFIAPAATDLYGAPWVIIKEFKTLSELQAVNSSKGVEVYKNLDQLEGARSNGDPIAVYKKARNRLTTQIDPYTVDRTVDFLDIYECYDKATMSIKTFANAGGTATKGESNWIEIRSRKLPYWHGKYPLVRFTVKQRPYDFWGQGCFETSHRMQVAMNDIVNHFFDNMNLALDGMLIAPESAGINDYVVEPGGLITYRTEEPKQFKFPDPNPVLFNTSMEFLMSQIESDTINGYAAGNPQSDTDKTRGTKGGILALQQAADDMTAFMRMNFQESIKTVGQMWLSNNQQFMSNTLTVIVKKDHTDKKVRIKPADLQANMELRVDEASMMPISDDQIKDQFTQFTGMLMQYQEAAMQQHNLLGTPPMALNYDEITNEAAEKFGFRNVQAFIAKLPKGPTPMEVQQAHQMAGQQVQMQTQAMTAQAQLQQAQQGPQAKAVAPAPTMQERMIESLNYKDVPDDIKRQMEAQAGFHPSTQPGNNTTDPATATANNSVHDLAQQLHAKGQLHPAVLDMVRSHMGLQAPPAPTPTPIGEPPPPPQQPEPAGV